MCFTEDPGVTLALVHCNYVPGSWTEPRIPPALTLTEYRQLLLELKKLLSRQRPSGRRHRFLGALPGYAGGGGANLDFVKMASWTMLVSMIKDNSNGSNSDVTPLWQ